MSYASKALSAASALLMGSSAIAAPLVLEGNYVKIGVNDAGTVGSGGNTSPGILYDSTGTATFNPSYDYLTPGSPFEGWTVKGIDTDGTTVLFNYTNNNTNVASPNITGTLVDYSGVSYRGLSVPVAFKADVKSKFAVTNRDTKFSTRADHSTRIS